MRLPVVLRRFAVATAALFALTGALGVANALPGPIQDAVSKVGIGSPSSSGGNHGQDVSEVAKDESLQGCEHGRAVSEAASGKANDKPCPNGSTPTTVSGSTTTVPGEDSTAATDDNEGTNGKSGNGVSGVAKDPALEGCEHGRAVSGAASGKTKDKPCPQSTTTTTTSVPGETTTEVTTTTAPGNSGGVRQDGTKPKDTGTNNGNGGPTGRTNANNSQNDD